MFYVGYVTPVYRQAGFNHENGLLVRVKVRKPVWVKLKGKVKALGPTT
jgi:hypothetical protein